MSYRYQKNPKTGIPEIIFNGWEKGVAASPHQGLGNLQGVNTSTEDGEAMASFARIQQSQVAGTGTFTQVDGTTVSVTGIALLAGSWVHITNGGTTGLTGDYYYIGSGHLSRKFVQNFTVSVKTLVVGGGGGGNGSAGGGGGGQAVDTHFTATPQAYTVTVGTGGAVGADGVDSTFAGITATSGKVGTNTGGVSGGGKAGGTGDSGTTGGGGGGSSAIGANSAGTTGGIGGAGISSTISGAAVQYGGGGGGGGSAGGAGTAGGATGGSTGVAATTATANRGGGGGGIGNGGGSAASAGADGVVVISYPTGTINATGGTITTSGGNTIHTFTTSGTWTYINSYVNGITAGTATFSVYAMGQPIESAHERYNDANQAIQYRYYILDNLGQIWVHDTATLSAVPTPLWFSPELPPTLSGRTPSGLGVLNGWLTMSFDDAPYWKPTSVLGSAFEPSISIILSTHLGHKTLSGHQGKMYWCDGNFVASVFPNSSQLSGASNLQSYCSYTAATDTGTVNDLIGGSYPNSRSTGARIPVIFYTFGTLPTALAVDQAPAGAVTTSKIYYIEWQGVSTTFKVYAALTGGSALDIQTGATDIQYFDTFNPVAVDSTALTNYSFSPQRLTLPFFETAQCMAEIGNTVIVGGATNTLYPWNQVSALPDNILPLPENNTVNLVTVDNYAYAFTGQKGNIYVTNGASVSLAMTVPDYCAGIPGTPSSYIEPYFSWGGASFLRGRVYFSILDQTAAKAGNCGGIWSFIPTQNFYIGQDVGLSLRLENQNSYGTYSGVATVILANQNQSAIGAQYWSGWYSSTSNPLYGIDYTDTIPTHVFTIDTDLVPTGTMLDKTTFNQIEYKLSSPLVVGDTVTFSQRSNSTSAFVSCGTVLAEGTTALSGYVTMNFELGQWIQLQITCTTLQTTGSSFIRLKEVILR